MRGSMNVKLADIHDEFLFSEIHNTVYGCKFFRKVMCVSLT